MRIALALSVRKKVRGRKRLKWGIEGGEAAVLEERPEPTFDVRGHILLGELPCPRGTVTLSFGSEDAAAQRAVIRGKIIIGVPIRVGDKKSSASIVLLPRLACID